MMSAEGVDNFAPPPSSLTRQALVRTLLKRTFQQFYPISGEHNSCVYRSFIYGCVLSAAQQKGRLAVLEAQLGEVAVHLNLLGNDEQTLAKYALSALKELRRVLQVQEQVHTSVEDKLQRDVCFGAGLALLARLAAYVVTENSRCIVQGQAAEPGILVVLANYFKAQVLVVFEAPSTASRCGR